MAAKEQTVTSTIWTAKSNVSAEVKAALARWTTKMSGVEYFGDAVFQKLETTEIEILESSDAPGKRQGRLVVEVDVTDDMCNPISTLHGGCIAALVDQCTSFVIALLSQYMSPGNDIHVSLMLNTTFHSPAPAGTRLRIVSTTVASGRRTQTARIEIYDKTRGRLVATGVHIKMSPSPGAKL
ncbi:Thioesterase/thiol ester dehydrase-isomerase [Trametopsis cervina]|nr:Thioesterase/thiol ester dehydrase-isomerase [Trametopsis cervina]